MHTHKMGFFYKTIYVLAYKTVNRFDRTRNLVTLSQRFSPYPYPRTGLAWECSR